MIHRGEIYETLSRTDWSHEAPKFGVAFSSRTLAVLIELPDDFAISNRWLSQMLHYVGNLQHRVTPRDFAALAAAHRPAWLLEIQARLGPTAVGLVSTGWKWKRCSVRCDSAGGSPTSPRRPIRLPPAGRPLRAQAARPPEDDAQYEVAPEIIPLTDLADIQERALMEGPPDFIPRPTRSSSTSSMTPSSASEPPSRPCRSLRPIRIRFAGSLTMRRPST